MVLYTADAEESLNNTDPVTTSVAWLARPFCTQGLIIRSLDSVRFTVVTGASTKKAWG